MVHTKSLRCLLATTLLLGSAGLGCSTAHYDGEGPEPPAQARCLVKPIFLDASRRETTPLDHVRSVTLIQYERQEQDEGVVVKRWPGDTSGQYKYVEEEKRRLTLADFPDGLIPLEPGLYQFDHNSVSGQPPSGYYGKSDFFEINAGDETLDVEISLFPAI